MAELKSIGGYIRVSTEEQSQKGLSIETQRQEIEDYCRQKGYRLTKLYYDRGITARKNLYKRQAFMDMMNDVQSGIINHIVVLRLDRFFRNVYDYHRMMNEFLIPARCEWSAIKEDYDTTTTNGRLMINLRLAIAEQECDQDSDRIKDILQRRATEGFYIGGNTPLGIKAEGGKLMPDENSGIVEDIFNTFLVECSIRRTMSIINGRYGLSLLYSAVKRILKNRIYIGEFHGNKDYCEPIIDRQIFDSVQRMVGMNEKESVKIRSYPFAGLLVCADCGSRMGGVACGKNHYKYYRCDKAYRDKACPHTETVSQIKIEKYLVAHIKDLMQDYVAEITAKEKSAPHSHSGNREQIEAKISRLNDLYINGIIGIDELKTRRAALEAQIVEDVVPSQKDLSAIEKLLAMDFKSIYGDLTDAEKKSLWRSVISRIIISKHDIDQIIFL